VGENFAGLLDAVARRRADAPAILCDDGALSWRELELRAGGVARRLSSVMRHTSHGPRDTRSEPVVTVATLSPKDSAKSLLSRLEEDAQRAAS